MRQTKILSGAQPDRLGLLLLFIILLLPTSSFAAEALYVHSGGDIVNQHILGNNLWVSVGGAQANTDYRLALYDGGTLVSYTDIQTNDMGEKDATRVWSQSGLVGCDEGANANPANYRFETFEDVESLHGDNFTLVLETLPGLVPVIQKNLPLVADTTLPRFFYSDEFGCPIFRIGNRTTIYISAIHLPAMGGNYIHWATYGPITPNSPQPPTDIRSLQPNGLSLSPTSTVMAPVIAFEQVDLPATLLCVHGTVYLNRGSATGPGGSGGSGGSGGTGCTGTGCTSTGGTGTPPSPNTFLLHPVIRGMSDPFNCPPCVDNMYP